MKIDSVYFFHDPDKTGVPYDPQCDDEEVIVTLTDGRKYYVWFFTLSKISENMKRHKLSGESGNGLFFWATNVVVIERISKSSMEIALKLLIEDDGDLSPFDEITQ